MKYYQCKCGQYQSWGSLGPKRCAWCKLCQTTPAGGPSEHKTEQPAHEMFTTSVEMKTDAGKVEGQLTRCIHCYVTKAGLEEMGEPMKPYQPTPVGGEP